MGWIQNWKDKRFKKRLERVLNNNVLGCNISIDGTVYALGKNLQAQGGGGGGNINGDKPNAPKHDNLVEPKK